MPGCSWCEWAAGVASCIHCKIQYDTRAHASLTFPMAAAHPRRSLVSFWFPRNQRVAGLVRGPAMGAGTRLFWNKGGTRVS